MVLGVCYPCAQFQHTLAASLVSLLFGGILGSSHHASKCILPPCGVSPRGVLKYNLPGSRALGTIPR